MRKTLAAILAILILSCAAVHAADAPKKASDKKDAAAAPPEMPKPQKEHQWLEKLLGDWEFTGVMHMDPQTSFKGAGTESFRSLGGFWVISEGTLTCEAMPETMKNVLTLGFDPAKGKFVGTWIDYMGGYLWVYEGTLEGDTLTLLTQGPCPMKAGATSFREVIEFKDADHKTFTSSIQNDDGTWMKMMEMQAHRKK